MLEVYGHCCAMKRIGIILGLTALFAANPAASQSQPVVGERHEIVVTYETSLRASNGSSSNSGGRNDLLERVIAVRDSGLELEFDLPASVTAADRARVWQYPVRVFQPTAGKMRLLNGAELEKRIDAWLADAGIARDMCGRWIFTWTAFRIECDQQSVIADIEAIDLRMVVLREGADYRHPGAVGSGRLSRTSDASGSSAYSVTLDVDVDAIRRTRAEGDVAVGQMTGQALTLEGALQERAKEAVTGTIEIMFEVDGAGNPTRRRVSTNLVTVKPDGVSETDRQIVTVERRRIP